MKGAQPTESARAILKYKGVIYKKHLLRGVKLGVVKEDDVETKFQSGLIHVCQEKKLNMRLSVKLRRLLV